ncbi:FK506-binding protein 2B [Linnemannia elongata]|nr:FK506-binding protein 2B [Linnemannia elongata]
MATPTQDWTTEQLLSDAVSKKDIVTFLHVNATHDFLVEFKLTGKLPTVVKNAPPFFKGYSSYSVVVIN